MIYDRNTIYAIGDTLYSSSCGYNNYYIRPVINLKKSAIDNNCKFELPLTCDKGDGVVYNSEKYYVLNDSNVNMSYVTLLKKNSLTANEINKYSNNYVS